VHGKGAADVKIEEIFANRAYHGIFRQFLTNYEPEEAAGASGLKLSMAAFDFINDAKEKFVTEPDFKAMQSAGATLVSTFVKAGGNRELTFLDEKTRSAIESAIASLTAATSLDESQLKAVRTVFDAAMASAVESIRNQCFAAFLSSEHFQYILELKAKEGFVPGLPDFRLIRVLGEGGFGQVLEVVKRDCGKHYAMKVMHKDLMRKVFAGTWRHKIWLEKDLMASLNHPFLVNLSYAFQNPQFLVLVMDLVPGGDLSDYVLTKKRLTAEQVRLVVMEVVCVMAYIHAQMVLYRDLKPENLLVDEHGHVRLIDMGLAARMSKQTPKRMSRVGTDCYMAPEVRWAKKRKQPYGTSCDWYTVGVLAYEFSVGDLPYDQPQEDNPRYAEFDFGDSNKKDLITRLLDQDHSKRLGCGPEGVAEIQRHPYWGGVEWDLLPLKKFESACKDLHVGQKTSKKKKREKEEAAIEVASEINQADANADKDQSAPVSNWDFVAPTAVIEEYMENMYHCVSAI